MSFYTHFHSRGNAIFLRYVDDEGRRKMKIVKDYQPTLYVKTHEESEYKDLKGSNLKPIRQNSIAEAREFIKKYDGIHGFEIYGNNSWEYAYINERWTADIQYDPAKVLTYYLDIETEVGDEFPDPYRAEQRINLITIFDGTMYRLWCFQDVDLKQYEGYQVDVRCLPNEDAMLKNFIQFWSNNYPDILTDWNGERFDVPYLINRIRSRLGEDAMLKLSPVEQLREYRLDSKTVGYDIRGIEHLDYMLLFKKFVPGERDFSLDAVCEDFLHANKLENPADSFKEFYLNHWQTFAEYNVRDVFLLHKLEDKLKFIGLTMRMAYMIKMNFSDVFGTVKPWDTFIQNYLYKQNQFVKTIVEKGNADRSIMGGFVKDPIPGRYDWVVSFDANSLYPSVIRSFNISPETILNADEIPDELLPYYDRLQDHSLTQDHVKVAPLLKKYNLAMTANGQFFRRDKMGILPLLCGMVYNGRVRVKNEMKEWKKKFQGASESEKLEIEKHIESLDAEQYAYKILLNSLFGATANSHFRFFDFRCAEGITSTGQYFIRTMGERGGEYLDKLADQTGISGGSLVYIDTDSVVGDTLIRYNDEVITIAEAFNRGGEVIQNDSRNYVLVPNATTLSMNHKGDLQIKKILHVMKHKVNKRMFKIKCGEKEVICTEDHSIIVWRDGEMVSIKPTEIRGGDKIATIS